MPTAEFHAVTGAFGFSGRFITKRLLACGIRVRTLTNRDPPAGQLGHRVEATPLHFDDPDRLIASLRGAAVLYNTYWIRFHRGLATHQLAVRNTQTLIRCATAAGVRRFVHISITNPSEDSPLSYFRGKALLERTLAESGLSHAILRPAVLFGLGDILINNIAWMLRRLPIFGIFGDGRYRLQPVYVDDLAALAISCAGQDENIVLDAVGPETFTYEQLVRLIRDALGTKAGLIHVSPAFGLAVGRLLGQLLGDVVITRQEIEGLMAGLLVSHESPTCPTRFTDWLKRNAAQLGKRYASEMARHYRRGVRRSPRP
jgi:NADH dehydrogenase